MSVNSRCWFILDDPCACETRERTPEERAELVEWVRVNVEPLLRKSRGPTGPQHDEELQP